MIKEVNAIVTNDKRVWIISNEVFEVEGATIVNADVFSRLRGFVNLFGQAYSGLKSAPEFAAMRPIALQLLTALMPTASPTDIENCFYIFEHSDI